MRCNELVAIVLAGNDKDAHILGGIGQPSKFFMPFGSERVGDRILQAIDALECCRAIYVVVPAELAQDRTFPTKHPLYLVGQGETHTESMVNAVQEAQRRGQYLDGDHLLIVMGDLPLLCTEALERFVSACQEIQGADCYIGMIPMSAVDPALQGAYQRDVMPFRNGLYLLSSVYLFRPDSLTKIGRKRLEQIMSIRRSDRNSLRDMLGVAMVLLEIVGIRGLFPFARTVMGLRNGKGGKQQPARSTLDSVERMALNLIEERLGPKVRLVIIPEPTLALEFDRSEQLASLAGYAGSHGL